LAVQQTGGVPRLQITGEFMDHATRYRPFNGDITGKLSGSCSTGAMLHQNEVPATQPSLTILSSLGEEVSAMDKALADLVSKIAPVLRPESPNCDAFGPGTVTGSSSELADRIETLVRRVRGITADIQHVTHRVDL
jgi:hypothetical protein